MFTTRQGLAALLKEGGKQFSGVSEVALKNIDACRAISNITQTSMGPNSMNKLLINHLDKQLVTSDAAVMMAEMEVQHPAAKMLVMAAKMQDNEFGDGTNFVLVVGGELLSQAENLLKQGIHLSDVVKGYEMAAEKCLSYLKESTCWTVHDLLDPKELARAIRTTLSSKHLGLEDELADMIGKAAVAVMPSDPNDFSVDNIRVCKITGRSVQQTYVVHGMVVSREPSGSVKSKKNCKVMVLGCGLEITGTEAKGTVLLSSAEELINFSKGEEDQMENAIRDITNAGVDVIIVNGSISDIAQHFCNRYKLLTLKVQSKFETRRLCKTLQATPLVRLGTPLPEEMGVADSIAVEEIASKKVTVVKGKDSKVATIVLRGSTPNTLDELERSIDDAVNCVRAITQNGRFVAGGGAVEIDLASSLQRYAAGVSGLDQYAIQKFAEALECVPRILAENAGHDSMNAITALYAAHQQGKKYEGIDVEGKARLTKDSCKAEVFDHLDTKYSGIALAVDAVVTILRLDHIIIARQAGGPSPHPGGPVDGDD